MSRSLTRIVLVGASGTVGSHVLKALLAKDGFVVTILSRPSSDKCFPEHSNCRVVKADFENLHELIEVFHGQDAVVHASAIPGISTQPLMIEAAVNAGVRRFILNEFANSYDQPGLPELEPFRTPKQNILELAKSKAAESNGAFSWSALATGNFLDYALIKYPQIGIDIRKRTARLIDEGNEPFSATVLQDIGVAVRGMLKEPDKTENRVCHVRSVETSQRKILDACEQALGETFQVEYVDGEELYRDGKAAFAGGERSGMVNILVVQLFQKNKNRSIVVKREHSDNHLLGVVEKSTDDVVRDVLHQMLISSM